MAERSAIASVGADPWPVLAALGHGDALIIVPPFIQCATPSLGAHLLQACAAQRGFRVNVFYASLCLLGRIGRASYDAIGYGSTLQELLGERFFARAAFDLPLLGTNTDRLERYFDDLERRSLSPSIHWADIRRLATDAGDWADLVADAVARSGYRVVGCTAVSQQTAASVALLDRVKRLAPKTISVIGGANCRGDLGKGVAALASSIDFVFSGEGEIAFQRFLQDVRSGRLPAGRLIEGEPVVDLDSLPPPDYGQFYAQLNHFVPDFDAGKVWLPYQSSRGCWWGRKHHCTFCGNYMGEGYREKSADRVVADLSRLAAETPSRRILFVDQIMPRSYFRTLLPRLAAELPDLSFFYEQKANMSLEEVLALRDARVIAIQPGIESLSTKVLRRMRKGVTAAQNVRLLRYARSARLSCVWNLLYGFPGDAEAEYHETLAVMPLLRHLSPPDAYCRISIDRASPYWESPAAFGLTRLRPFAAYSDVFPSGAPVERLAYHFEADYPSGSKNNRPLTERITAEVERWRKAWMSAGDGETPQLWVNRLAGDMFLIRDTRGLPGMQENRIVGLERATAALVAGAAIPTAAVEWALEQKVGIMLDGGYVPLATATPALLLEMEAAHARARS